MSINRTNIFLDYEPGKSSKPFGFSSNINKFQTKVAQGYRIILDAVKGEQFKVMAFYEDFEPQILYFYISNRPSGVSYYGKDF